MAKKEHEKCANCVYFIETDEAYECHLNPPVFIEIIRWEDWDDEYVWKWPGVPGDGWCGQYKNTSDK